MLTSSDIQQRRAEREKRWVMQREDDLKQVLGTPLGRRFFWDVMDRLAGLHELSFRTARGVDGRDGDGAPLLTAYNEGRRSIGVDLMLAAQRIAPQSYVQMMLDAVQGANADASLRAAEGVPKAGDRSST